MILDIVGYILLIAGSLFGIIGAIGLLRFPDFFTRIHAAGITDTLCAGLILTGLVMHAPSFLAAVKLILILFFLLFTTPTATHALAKAALQGGYRPLQHEHSIK